MNDTVAIQYALFRGLRSCTLFNDCNIILGRELMMQSEIELSAIWQTPSKSNKQGVGIIVNLPNTLFPKPNSLQRQREFSISIFEERNFNFTPGVGTFVPAEDWADLLLDFLWNWRLWRASGLILEGRALADDNTIQGVIGIRASALLRQERLPAARCATPAIAVDGSNVVTLSVADSSQIYFTTDGASPPMPDNIGSLAAEEAATLYTAPFQADSGDIISAMSFADGLLPSQIATQEIP